MGRYTSVQAYADNNRNVRSVSYEQATGSSEVKKGAGKRTHAQLLYAERSCSLDRRSSIPWLLRRWVYIHWEIFIRIFFLCSNSRPRNTFSFTIQSALKRLVTHTDRRLVQALVNSTCIDMLDHVKWLDGKRWKNKRKKKRRRPYSSKN